MSWRDTEPRDQAMLLITKRISYFFRYPLHISRYANPTDMEEKLVYINGMAAIVSNRAIPQFTWSILNMLSYLDRTIYNIYCKPYLGTFQKN